MYNLMFPMQVHFILNLDDGFKINPGFAILLVAMIIIGLMSLRRTKK